MKKFILYLLIFSFSAFSHAENVNDSINNNDVKCNNTDTKSRLYNVVISPWGLNMKGFFGGITNEGKLYIEDWLKNHQCDSISQFEMNILKLRTFATSRMHGLGLKIYEKEVSQFVKDNAIKLCPDYNLTEKFIEYCNYHNYDFACYNFNEALQRVLSDFNCILN